MTARRRRARRSAAPALSDEASAVHLLVNFEPIAVKDAFPSLLTTARSACSSTRSCSTTRSTPCARDHLSASGLTIDDANIERLSPLGTDYITHWPLPNRALGVATRPRRLPRAQSDARSRGLARFYVRTLYRPLNSLRPALAYAASIGCDSITARI